MADRPSITSDYVSVIARTIENAQNDPAQLRSLVYDIARSCLCKHVLLNYHELGNARWHQQMLHLEEAINQVESLSLRANEALTDDARVKLLDGPVNSPDHQAESPSQRVSEAGTDDPSVQLPNGPANLPDHNALVVRVSLSDATQPTPTEIYRVDEQFPEIIQPSEIWAPGFGSGQKRIHIDFPRGLQVAIAAFVGVVIYAVLLAPFGYIQAFNHSTAGQLAAQGAAPPIPANGLLGTKVSLREANSASVAQELGFSPPTVYGVYAVSGGKLFTLDPLPIKVPDPRVGISAMITEPSHVTVPDGKMAFVLYRRDLASSAPTEAFVRVVARVERGTKFNAAGPPTLEKIDGQWAIRNKSYDFKVSPIDDNPEMIVLHSEDPNLVLSAGRYALAIAGHGYDFTVAGQMTDTAHCLERTDVVGGTVYSECRTLL
jgi:hypothetical protein